MHGRTLDPAPAGRFSDSLTIDRILAKQPARRAEDHIREHEMGGHTELGGGPGRVAACPLCPVAVGDDICCN
jgi:hypothetical protein